MIFKSNTTRSSTACFNDIWKGENSKGFDWFLILSTLMYRRNEHDLRTKHLLLFSIESLKDFLI